MALILKRLANNKTFLVLVLCLATIGLVCLFYHHWMVKQQIQISQQQEMLSIAYHASTQTHRLAMDMLQVNIIQHPNIIKMFADGVGAAEKEKKDIYREILYGQLYMQFAIMQLKNVLQLNFHTADGESFLRFHKPSRHGDALNDIRPLVRIVNEKQTPVSGFEAGRFRSAFRYLYPIFSDGKHIGSVEFGVAPKAILDAMAELAPGRELALILNRCTTLPILFPEQGWLYQPSGIHPDFITENTAPWQPHSYNPFSDMATTLNRSLFHNQNVRTAMDQGVAATISVHTESQTYIVSLLPIRDVKDRVAGYLVSYSPDPLLNEYQNDFLIYIATAMGFIGIIATLLLGLHRKATALELEQHNSKTITDTLAEGVYVTDQAGVIQRINSTACRMLGFDPDEMIGQSVHHLIHCHPLNDHMDREDCAFARTMSNARPYDGEELFQRKDGSVFTVKVASRPITVQNCWVGSVTAFHDISERKRTEEALRKSEEKARKLSAAVEQNPVSIIITDLEGCVEYVNPKFVTQTGFTAQEIVGLQPHVMRAGRLSEEVHTRMRATISAGRVWQGEFHNQRKNGERYWELASISPIRNNRGRVTHYLVIKEDISKRKQMETELREKEENQRMLMENLPVGFIVIDTKTRIIERVNPTAARLLGAPAGNIIGRCCHRFICPADVSCCPILDLNQGVDSSDRVLLRHDGKEIPVLKTVTRISIQQEEKLVECIIDISSRIAAEKALKKANQKLELAIDEAEELAERAKAANQSKSIFLANMSHEIRTPLNAILGYSQLLQQDAALRHDHLEQIRTINRSGDHLLELINNILEMSKIEAGQIRVANEPMNLKHLIEDIDAIFRLSCQRKNIRLITLYADRLPERIIADRGKLRQILINLMSNAVKFTNQGDIELRTTATPVGEARWTIGIDIKDSGYGIAKDEQSCLFQAFEQSDSGRKSSEGTGLGLSISRAYARTMGGDLELVHSTVGNGSVFRLTIPVGRIDGVRQEAESIFPKRAITGLMPGQTPMRTLIVDDDPVSRMLLSKLLQKLGFDVHMADSGQAALDVFEKIEPRLVLMDIVMDGIDGYEAARRIRARNHDREIRIIAVTASGTNVETLRLEAENSGIDALVVKPFKLEAILNLIESLCGVMFMYEVPLVEEDDILPAHSAALAVLPDDLRNALRSTIEMGDMVAFNQLVEEVERIDSGFESRLVELARRYDYEKLLEVLGASPTMEEQG